MEQVDIEPTKRSNCYISPLGLYLGELEKYKSEAASFEKTEAPAKETEESKRLKLKQQKQAQHQQLLEQQFQRWNPDKDVHIKGDPFKTVFLARLDYAVDEVDLQKEFSRFGTVESVRIVRDKETGKSRGYAFIVYERESGARTAAKEANGLRIKSRVILTDIERGRTIKDWVPRRLGGGLGGRKMKLAAYKDVKPRISLPRGPAADGFRSGRGGPGGGRGGGRGGFRGPPPRSGFRGGDRGDRGDRFSRNDRDKRFEYSSRSRRDGRDDRERERFSERDRERNSYRERKMHDSSRLRY